MPAKLLERNLLFLQARRRRITRTEGPAVTLPSHALSASAAVLIRDQRTVVRTFVSPLIAGVAQWPERGWTTHRPTTGASGHFETSVELFWLP